MIFNKITKILFQKVRRVKKPTLLSKPIDLVTTAWTLKYDAINSNEVNRVSPLQVNYNQKPQPFSYFR